MKSSKITLLIAIFQESFDAIFENGIRSALSLLGITIGIASIVAVTSINSSGKDLIFSELETFGLRSVWIYRHIEPSKFIEKDKLGSGIDEHDYKEIQQGKYSSFNLISPVLESHGETFIMKHEKNMPVKLVGINEEYNLINNDTLFSGRFVNRNDIQLESNVVVIGYEIKEKIFKDIENPIGERVNIGKNWFVVIGVLNKKNREFISSIGARKENVNSRVLIPYSTFQKIIGDKTRIDYLQAQSVDIDRANDAAVDITSFLKAKHNGEYHYQSESMSQHIAVANRILKIVSIIGVVAAAVSLFVGGLAIMNIMFTSVIERTKEIGLRKSIGATKKMIQIQFLIESIFLTTTGGLLGVFFGYLIVKILNNTTSLPVEISYVGLILGLLSAVCVGIISGWYPSFRASEMIPVEALRYE